MLASVLYLFLTGHSLTVNPVAFTFHGIAPEPGTEKVMPYKLTSDGRWTFHPGFGLLYRHSYFQAGAMYFRDSFGKHAGALLLGPNLNFWKYFHIGLAGGFYARENTVGVKKFPVSYKTSSAEFIPMAVANFHVTAPIYKNVSLETGVNSNYVLSVFTVGLKFDFK